MTPAIRPKSGKPWEDEVPESENCPEFDQTLYLVAAGARMGWQNMPKRGLSITEQAYVASLRTLVENMNTEFSIAGGLLKQYGLLSSKKEALTPGQISLLISWGRTLLSFAYVANANPEVGHFVGAGSDQNEKNADKFLTGSG